MRFEKAWNYVKKHTKEFIEDESGMELLQWAIIVVLVVALFPAAKGIASIVEKRLTQSGETVDSGFNDVLNGDM